MKSLSAEIGSASPFAFRAHRRASLAARAAGALPRIGPDPVTAMANTEAGGVVTWLLIAILAISVGAGGAIATFGRFIAPH